VKSGIILGISVRKTCWDFGILTGIALIYMVRILRINMCGHKIKGKHNKGIGL
jgi:hypothetical protein